MPMAYVKRNNKEGNVGLLKQAMDKGFKEWFLMAKEKNLESTSGKEY